MNIELTDLIISQGKTFIVMICAGIAVYSLWKFKECSKGIVQISMRKRKTVLKIGLCVLIEAVFWAAAAVTISEFLYYCAYGRISLHAAASFFTGLLLWKKICCGILKEVWVEKDEDEAENLKTTARSSISNRPENKGWKRGTRKKGEKKKK